MTRLKKSLSSENQERRNKMTIQKAIKKIIGGSSLTQNESKQVMEVIMRGEATDAQIAAYLIALRVKGETVGEIAGSAQAMRLHATKVRVNDPHAIDTCGTGGDAMHTFNISTAAALVAAGSGITVAKHGNRSVSSHCGSADILKQLGVNIDIEPSGMEKCLEEVGMAFLFAPKLHLSMKYAIGPRREIGVRTIFNILGPLTNPAGARRQLIGVFDGALLKVVCRVLRDLGSVHIMAVYGQDGLDEISITGPTSVCEYKGGHIHEYIINPETYGFTSAPLSSIQSKCIEENESMILSALRGEPSPVLDAVLLNSGAVLKVGGKVNSMEEGVAMARQVISNGNAIKKLEQLKAVTNSM
jgi:anthranilate phosphoribosyltransferase